MRTQTMLELIKDYGQAIGYRRNCSCCNKACLYSIHYPGDVVLVVCAQCDTER